MDSVSKYLNKAEFAKKRPGDGAREKMFLIETNGIVKTANALGPISITQNQGTSGKLPYFLKVSKIREIIYCAEGRCDRKNYAIWHRKPIQGGGAGLSSAKTDVFRQSVKLGQSISFSGPSSSKPLSNINPRGNGNATFLI